ncbi:MAG TPA: phosphatidate cytidylyltransferase [Methylomirabilota bacterium]|nr:phosphatidate cytidylyltransferase [Methylomirabilota bacterium]
MNGEGGPVSGESGPRGSSDLKVRAISALVMIAVALGALWAGGWVFAVVVALAVALVMLEWATMSGPFATRMADKAAVGFVAISVVASYNQPSVSLFALGAVALGMAMFGVIDPRMRWLAGGILYAGAPGVAAVALRGTAAAGAASTGLFAIAFVFLVVWATDSAAYFAGRRFGGPKLMPRFSPKKTWSGAFGGATAALCVGLLAGAVIDGSSSIVLAVIAIALSIVSQIGDLGESAMKRHFNVKDSGRLIPGHGGIMDRVDGLVVALTLAAAIGLVRSGGTDAAGGLLLW